MKKKKNFFNLVEVALAIGVAGIGIAGVMVLFPVGLNATRDAIGENYASNAAEQFISYIKRDVNEDPINSWNNFIVAGSPSGFSTETDLFFPATDEGTPGPILNADTGTTTKLYMLGGNPSIYRVTQGTISGVSSVTDFDGVIRIWKSPTKSSLYAGSWKSWTDHDYGSSAGLNVEISWPKSKPYNVRSKALYYFEIYKSL